ncbi:MAG: 6-phosphogluconolactonase [Sphingomonadaceae bacterium]|nr:6-phosphogluconolactonase [Sphingomonadaceae bacterium]MBH1997642.1 6-phosphogluconolactonase [Sphingomonadaceae bacterium]
MADIREFRFPDARAAADALAQAIADRLAAAIAERATATVALSGGRSPAAVFEALHDVALPWDKVVITQVDERWVPMNHPDSNSQLIRCHLLQGFAAAARFVPMKNDASTARAGQPECEAALHALPLPFDVMLLGMGEDGHTASLFPEAAELQEGLTTRALTLALTPPAAPHERMSLSARGLLESRVLILQIGGAAKEAVYRAALAQGPVEDMPIRAILRQTKVPVEVWISE